MRSAGTKKKEFERKRGAAEQIEDSVLDELTPRWTVATSGHRWVDVDGHRVLTDDSTLGAKLLSYNPLRSDLRVSFRQFAAVEPSEAGFLEYAKRFGRLGLDSVPVGRASDVPFATGEKWDDWFNAHDAIASTVQLWNRIQVGDVSECISNPRGKHWIHHEPGLRTAVIRNKRLEEHEPLAAARRFVQDAINNGLAKRIVTRVLWHPDKKCYVFRVLPKTLLGCMWWQFAFAFTGEVLPGECEICGKPIPRGSGGFRASARFCSDACKQRAYRSRKKTQKSPRKKGK